MGTKAVNIFEARMGRAITRRKAPFLIGSESFPLLIFFPFLSRFSLLYLILSLCFLYYERQEIYDCYSSLKYFGQAIIFPATPLSALILFCFPSEMNFISSFGKDMG